jgi:glycerol kinase
VKEYVLAIDHGTTSTRAVAVDNAGTMLAVSQKEHQQILPRAGWVEHDPREIWENTRQVLEETLQQLGLAEVSIVAVGVANQRETTVVWDKHTGIPVYNAIVWQDTRTHEFIESLSEEGGIDRFRNDTGLPLAPYFSASKLWWILSHVEGVRERAMAGDLMAGTMDSWLVWNLTGGVQTGQHVTDVTNASRTLLMDLKSLTWREDLAAVFDIPLGLLPRIVASSQVVGPVVGFEGLKGVPVAGILGDQQAACFGQAAVYPGESKNTFGTANGLLVNIGGEPVTSSHGLITTVAYQLEGHAPTYALEGIIAVAGSLIHWLRDNLKIISAFNDVEPLANEVDDNGGVYIVPAFSGLFAPYWRSDARGVIVGLTHFVNQAHIARAALEAIAFQSAEILHAMREDSGVDIHEIRVDGGMVRNELLMQMHANIAGIPVIRPSEIESTALGAAYAAGIAVGFWSGLEDIRENWREDKRWLPDLAPADRDHALSQWAKAVEKSLGWVD